MNLDELVGSINSVESLEQNTIKLYTYLKDNNVTLVDAEKILIQSFVSDYFIILLRDVFLEEKNQEILRLFVQFSLLGFTKLIYNKEKFYFQEDFIKKVKSIFYLWEEKIGYGFNIAKILHTIRDIGLDEKYQKNFRTPLGKNFDYLTFFNTIQFKSNILGTIFFAKLNYDFSLKVQLQSIINFIEENERNNILTSFNKIFGIINKSNGLTIGQKKLWVSNFQNDNIDNFINIISSINDQHSYSIINYVVSGFPNGYIENFDYGEILFGKILQLIHDKSLVSDIIESDLKYFNEKNIGYIDKLCFITLKMICIFEIIEKSKNNDWKIRVILRELNQWLKELHYIINKFDLIDDWDYIKKFLLEENDEIEWKSSFLTPIKYKNPNFKKDNYKKIAETIISMMNTSGGNIIIGHIEDLKGIDSNIKYFTKEKKYFFNVEAELKKFDTSIDEIVREIQEIVKNELGCNIVDFDYLFSIKEKNLKINGETVCIYIINIRKSERQFYSLHSNNNSYITLRKRVKGKNECILPKI